MKLTEKQKKFCIEYVKTGNATQSALKVGYSKKNARNIASENLAKPNIKEYIAKLMKPKQDKEKKDIAELEEVLAFFTSVMRGEVKDQFDLDAMLKDRLEAGKELKKRYEVIEFRDVGSNVDKEKDINAIDGIISQMKDLGDDE